MKHTAVKGMHDILPAELPWWRWVEQQAHRVFARYGFRELRTPILEKKALFVRGVGTGSDIVQKEMYTFVDQGGEELALRPEETAAVVRAYVEQGLYQTDAVGKYYYLGPMFRRERPQKGRYRQFHQLGVELFGAAHPFADAEVIAMAMELLRSVELNDVRLEINSLGCDECRPKYHASLQEFLTRVEPQLCEECRRRMQTNPQRIFDCKEPNCQEALSDAPSVQDFWCPACAEHFQGVCDGLEHLQVPYWCNHRIARGLDYYMRTAFEIISHDLGAQSALCGGGRYDGLVKDLGGPEVPGVGFAIGFERLILLLMQQRAQAPLAAEPTLFVAALGAEPRRTMLPVIAQLRQRGWRVEWDYDDRSLKAQLRRADREQMPYVVIVGDDELAKGQVTIRNMLTKDQTTTAIERVVEYFTSLHDIAEG